MYFNTLDIANLIAEKVEMAAGSHACVFLAQRTGSGIARIGEESAIADLRVQFLEIFDRHIDFAANLNALGDMLAAQILRNTANCAHIGRPILTNRAIAARSPDDQFALLVSQGQRET